MVADVEAAVYDRLRTAPGVGGAVGGRVFPEVIPAVEPFPAIAYMMTTRNYPRNLDGVNGQKRCKIRDPALFAAHSEAECRGIMDSLLPLFHRQYGTWSGVEIQSSAAVDSSDDYNPPSHASDEAYYMLTQEFAIYHRNQP